MHSKHHPKFKGKNQFNLSVTILKDVQKNGRFNNNRKERNTCLTFLHKSGNQHTAKPVVCHQTTPFC